MKKHIKIASFYFNHSFLNGI